MATVYNKLKTLSIKQKMLSGFGIMLIILALIAIKTLSSLLGIKESARVVVTEHQVAVITVMELSNTIEKSLSSMGFYLLSKEPGYKDTFEEKLIKAESLLKKLKGLQTIKESTNSLTLVSKIETDFNAFKGFKDTMMELAIDNQKNFPGMSMSAREINPITQGVLQNIAIMISGETDESERKQNNELLQTIFNMRYTWSRLMNGIRAYLGFRNETALDEIKNYQEIFTQYFNEIQNNYADILTLEQLDAFEQISNSVAGFSEKINSVLEMHGSNKWRQDAYMIRSEIGPILTRLNSNLHTLTNNQTENITVISNDLVDSANNTTIIVISMLLVAMGGVALLAYLLLFGILKPMTIAVDSGIASIKKIMENVSSDEFNELNNTQTNDDAVNNVAKTLEVMSKALQKTIIREQKITEELRNKINILVEVVTQAEKGDLTGHISDFDGNDDIDILAEHTQSMINQLNNLVSKVQQSGILVNSSATEIAATAKQQEATVSEQAASTNEIMATVTEISATNKELLRTMEEIATVSETTASAASDGQNSLSRMGDAMHHMRSSTDNIASKLAILNEKASNINTVVTTINKVADQTNLLSLNAAIEAEKAGEYGKGFAVVATEIRRLADQTAVATWDIEQMVKEMQSAVSAGVMGMDKFSDDVSRSVDEIGQIGSQLGTIIVEVQALTPRFENVTEGMQSQSLGSEQITESMIQLNDTAHQTADSLRQSNKSIQNLKQASNSMQQAVSLFKVK
ncbi:MAG: methyl-accepting chemotaxis protein [Gammaproteobacteria bacterium]|nr:methyl-accepting chemotaxis protein [Gammaproteobacteria bacterium]